MYYWPNHLARKGDVAKSGYSQIAYRAKNEVPIIVQTRKKLGPVLINNGRHFMGMKKLTEVEDYSQLISKI